MAPPSDNKRKARLDAESGTVHKPWHHRTRVALVYPNHYAVGMANLGFQTVYRQLNAMDRVVCERAFLPEGDDYDAPLLSLESGRPLRDFDCLAFSLSFENDYINVLTVLRKAEIPLPATERGIVPLPLVLAGGVSCFLNPEPLAPFIDCFLIGEAETLIQPFFSRFDPAAERRPFLLEAARDLPGVYVPAFYQDQYHSDGTLAAMHPLQAVPEKVARVLAPDIAGFNTESAVITPHTSFADAHLIEVSRGCPHGCRFCAAGYLYRPPRFRPLPQLLNAMRRAGTHTCKIGLLGAAVSDLPDLKALCEAGSRSDLQLSFSSLRADALDDALVAALKAGRLKTATLAPETGSERMRRVINKGLDEAAILKATEALVANGIPNLKLYFMVGLPTESDADVDEVTALVKRIKHTFLSTSRTRRHMGEITVSLNSFVPKPFTPFQWTPMDELPVLKQKIRRVQQGLKKIANVRVHADVPRWAQIQALLSRGDRRVAQLLASAHQNNGNWPQTFKASALNPFFYIHRERPREELLPWDFIDHGLDKNFLWNEYQRALQAKPTLPCPVDPEKCAICGVCRRSK
ncbi:MAG: radical SAM protein [Desulfobacteraceae bacterium]|nr:MAG: radical SAM protein [Desulfobacteraceae bacterium]